MAIWHTVDILQALNLKGDVSSPFQATGISIDTRTLKPGDLFIALKGENFDGHDFLEQAFEKGASGVIISQEPPNFLVNHTYFKVSDPLKALQQLGQYARSRSSAKVIAVTGSAGKTTTKEWLAQVLGSFGSTVFSKASYNNHLGVPLSLAQLEPDTQFGVFEVGMNHGGEIEPLSQLIQPDIAIITTISEAHLGYFDSIEAIAEEKSNIFKGLKPGGTTILNHDNPFYEFFAHKAQHHGAKRILSVGQKKGSYIQLIEACYDDSCHQTLVKFKMGEDILTYSLDLVGEYYVINSLMVLAATKALGLDLDHSIEAVQTLKPIAGRGQRYTLCLTPGKTITLIDDAYNAHPTSMKSGLSSLAQIQSSGRKIVVLGEMRELGDKADCYHKELIPLLNEAGVDLIFATGPCLKPVFDAFLPQQQGAFQENALDLWQPLLESLRDGDTVFIKGSNGTKVYTLVHKLLSLHQDVLSSHLDVA